METAQRQIRLGSCRIMVLLSDEDVGLVLPPSNQRVGPKPGLLSDEDVGLVLSPTESMPAQAVSSAFQFGSEAINRFVDNIVSGVPNLVATTAANIPDPLALARQAVSVPQIDVGGEVTGGTATPTPSVFESVTGQQPPQLGEQVLPIPTAEQARAGISAIASDPLNVTGAFQTARAEQETRQEAAPIATLAGETAGDIATILTGRAPGVTRAAQASTRAARVPAVQISPGFRRAIDRTFKSKTVTGLGKAAGKATEAGLEGATLAILQGNDPLEVGAFTAAGQTAGSLFLKLGVTKAGLAGTALATAAWLQAFESVTPGDNRTILSNIETGFEKASYALAVGTMAGLAGAGRLRGRAPKAFEDFPKLIDGVTAIPRAALVSLFNDSQRDTDGRMKAVVSTLAEEPETFSPRERDRIVRAVKKGNLLDTIDGLAKSKSFRRKLDDINPQDFPATAS